MFNVDSDYNPILIISGITYLILPPSVISIAYLTSFGTWKNSEKLVSSFLQDSCLFDCLFISTTVFLGINGDIRVIFRNFYFITSLFIIPRGFTFVAPQ